MKLTLTRRPSSLVCTIGQLQVNDYDECFTLEDVIREVPGVPVSEWKIKDQTAIAAGTYDVELTFSDKFQRILPLLIGVEGFDGIRIHCGNTDVDTSGCILVGSSEGLDMIYGSRPAFSRLFPQMTEAVARGERITIEIINGS